MIIFRVNSRLSNNVQLIISGNQFGSGGTSQIKIVIFTVDERWNIVVLHIFLNAVQINGVCSIFRPAVNYFAWPIWHGLVSDVAVVSDVSIADVLDEGFCLFCCWLMVFIAFVVCAVFFYRNWLRNIIFSFVISREPP